MTTMLAFGRQSSQQRLSTSKSVALSPKPKALTLPDGKLEPPGRYGAGAVRSGRYGAVWGGTYGRAGMRVVLTFPAVGRDQL